MTKDIVTLVGGFLSALLLFLGTLNVEFQWFTRESIDAFLLVLTAAIPLAGAFYAIWKNTHLMKRLRERKARKEKGL